MPFKIYFVGTPFIFLIKRLKYTVHDYYIKNTMNFFPYSATIIFNHCLQLMSKIGFICITVFCFCGKILIGFPSKSKSLLLRPASPVIYHFLLLSLYMQPSKDDKPVAGKASLKAASLIFLFAS